MVPGCRRLILQTLRTTSAVALQPLVALASAYPELAAYPREVAARILLHGHDETHSLPPHGSPSTASATPSSPSLPRHRRLLRRQARRTADPSPKKVSPGRPVCVPRVPGPMCPQSTRSKVSP